MTEQYIGGLNQGTEQPIFSNGEDASMAYSSSTDMYMAQLGAASQSRLKAERRAERLADGPEKEEAVAEFQRLDELAKNLSRCAFESGKNI